MEDLNKKYYIPYRVCPNKKPYGNGIKFYIPIYPAMDYYPYNSESVKAFAEKYSKERDCDVKIVEYVPLIENTITINNKTNERR